MDCYAPRRSGLAIIALLVSVAITSCGQSESSRGATNGGQGGQLSFAGTSAAGAGGSRLGGQAGSDAVGGELSGGGMTGPHSEGGRATGGSPIALGGGAGDGSSATGGGTVALGGGAGDANSATGGGVTAHAGGAVDGSATQGGTAGNNAAGAAPTGGNMTGAAGGEGCVATLGDYCRCMPRFVGAQVIDGAGNEFAALAPLTFALSAAPYLNPGRSSSLPEMVTLRAGWSDIALHVHVHVDDPSIVPDPSESLWNGDNVQLFVAPTDNLTGTYTGTEDGGAIHVLISAPDVADVSHAITIYQNGVSTNTPFITGLFASRRVTGGYEIEAQLHWLLVANPRQSGARIGFDLLVGAASDPSQGLALEGGLANNPVSASSPACDLGGRVQPGCDDRTWCRPVLE